MWFNNPCEPNGEPTRPGPNYDGISDDGPAFPPYYQLSVRSTPQPGVGGLVFPDAEGDHILQRLAGLPFFSDPIAPALWVQMDIQSFEHWVLGFNYLHAGSNGNVTAPESYPGWSLWYRTGLGTPEFYPIWVDGRYAGAENAFDPLAENTFREKTWPLIGDLADPRIFAELPQLLTVRPWWP